MVKSTGSPEDEPPKKRGHMIEDILKEDDDCFKKKLVSVQTNSKFKIKRRIYKMLFENLIKCADPKQSLLDSLSETLEKILQEDPVVTKVGVSVQSPALENSLSLPFMDIKRNVIEVLGNSFFKLQQSERMVPLFEHPLHISMTTYAPPVGSGFDPLMGNIDFKNMINVNLSDNYCLFHAIVASIAYHSSRGHRAKRDKFNSVYNNVLDKKDFLKFNADVLIQSAKIDPNLSGYGMQHVNQVQQYFINTFDNKFCILVFGTHSYTKPVYKGNVENPMFYLSLFYFEEHFYVIKNLNLFCTGKPRYGYCVPCESTYSKIACHSSMCPRKCNFCNRMGRSFPCLTETKKMCYNCNRNFPNQNCFDHHLKTKLCGRYTKCTKCYQTYRNNTKAIHTCGDSFCKRCYVYHQKQDQCFIKTVRVKNDEIVRYVVFDFETTQDTVVEENVFEHEVNFICAYVFCTVCLNNSNFMEGDCVICGPKIKKWSAANGDNCIFDFTKWIIYDLDKKYKTIALSHFGGRFDNIFVLKQLFKLNLNPICVKNGNKFYEITIKKGRNTAETKDSYNFMSVPLSSLVKTFNLPIQEKMFFPHLYNCAKNYSTKLSHLPDKSFYLYKTMSKSNQKLFESWYTQNYCTPFYLPEKLDEYCTNDVEILSHALVEFRKIFLNLCELDPLKESCTIAGACMKTYRSKFLPEKTLAIVPEHGYQKYNNSSTIAMKYFAWLEETTKKSIRHKNSPQGEFKIGKYTVDGYIEAENRVIEFYGCAFHGHPKCFKADTILPTKRTAAKEYERTMERENYIKELGYTVESVWECELRKQLKKDKEMNKFFKNVVLGGHINPREAYFGGRCNPHKLHSKKGNGKVIKYLDFTSLYPSCNYETEYPVGIPEIIEVDYNNQNVMWTQPSDHNIKGLLKVFIIPPRNLLIPVVPYKVGEFLLFPLCRTCCKIHEKDESSRGHKDCNHSDDERGFVSTLTHLELNLALTKQYIVTKFYSAYNYKTWSSDLFKPYVKKFLRLKVESDGWPPDVKTEEDKDKFIREYKEKFDIDIDKSNVQKNSGYRFICKLKLNSLWGRFSLRNGLSKTLVSDDPLEIDKIVSGDVYEVSAIDLLDKNKVMIIYNNKKDFIVENDASNIIISLWTTSAARVKLYEIMDIIVNTPGCTLIYTDTDSVIFECPEDFCPLKTGNYLGELTNEVGPNEEIIEVVVGGNKQYALAIRNIETDEITYSLKLRGITLNAETSSELHYEKFKQMVLEYDKNDYVELNYKRILPKRTGEVITKDVPKKYKVVYKKGYVGDDLIVYPFGYKC